MLGRCGRARVLAGSLLLVSQWLACQERLQDDRAGERVVTAPAPPHPNRADVARQMRTARAVSHHPGDGGGRAWIAGGPASVPVSSEARWRFTYEAGEEGIAAGGAVIFMVSPFWGWSSPQDRAKDMPGFVSVDTDAAGVELAVAATGSPMMAIRIDGRGLRPGERVHVDYGGSAGARTDRFAESRSIFWFGSDADGDGTHRFLVDSPHVEVTAGPPTRLVAMAPSTVRPREEFSVRISALDRRGNAGTDFTGEIRIASDPPGLVDESVVAVAATDRGSALVALVAPGDGVFRLSADAGAGLQAISNPIVVVGSGPRIYWADLHGHSALSDGTGTADDYFRYAKDVAALDIAALTDHDHWGVLHLDETPALWEQIRAAVVRYHRPGSFVALLGYEWTSWEYGHRHVLHFADAGPLYSSIDPDFDTPQKLWDALRGGDSLTMAHHSAGGPIATDWSIAPDPLLEPITEVVSVHGVSEAADSPAVIYDALPGNFVRDVLARGYQFGFVGSGDSHDGHPGLSQLSSGGTGGLAAVLAEDLTRPAVLDSLRRRRVYATSGPRIYLRVALATHPMGSAVAVADLAAGGQTPGLFVQAVGTGVIRWLDVVRTGAVVRSEVGLESVEMVLPLVEPKAGEYVYVRLVQEDGGLAWSSPIYFE